MEQLEQTLERVSQKAGGMLANGITLSRHYAGVCVFTNKSAMMSVVDISNRTLWPLATAQDKCHGILPERRGVF